MDVPESPPVGHRVVAGRRHVLPPGVQPPPAAGMHEGAVAAAYVEDGAPEALAIGGDALLRHPGVLLGRVAVDAAVIVPGVEVPVSGLAERNLLALYAAMPAQQDRQARTEE